MNTNAKFKWLIWFLAVSVLLSTEILVKVFINENFSITFKTAAYIVSILLFICIFIYCFSFQSPLVFSLLLGCALAASFFCLKLNFIELISRLSFLEFLGLYLIIAILCSMLLFFWIKKKSLPLAAFYLIPLLIFVPSLLIMLASHGTLERKNSHDQWQQVKLEDKPNIYLISYDSMIASDVAEQYMQVPVLPYQETIDKHFYESKPAISIKVPTRPSLNAVMALDQKSHLGSNLLFSGHASSPLTSLFHANDYHVVTGYTTYFFGKKGPYIDKYIVPETTNFLKTTACIGRGSGIASRTRFFSVCEFFEFVQDKLPTDNWHQHIINSIRTISQSQKPTVSLFYTYRPNGHTNEDYIHTDLKKRKAYRDYFIEGASQLNTQLLEIHQTIMALDPSAIVMVFGDHGTYISRGIDKDKSTNKHFFYKDRYRILVALMQTENHCSNPKPKFSQHYATPSRRLLDIIQCLTADKTLLQTIVDFEEPKHVLNYALGPVESLQ